MTSDLFGQAFELPSFPHPNSYRRNVVPGLIPSPTLLTETVRPSDLAFGDLVLYVGALFEVVFPVDSDSRELRLRVYGRTDEDERTRQTSSFPVLTSTTAAYERVTEITFGMIEQGIPVRWIRNDSERYYGKFSSQWEEYCYETSFDADETAGSCSELGWHAALVTIKYRRDGMRDTTGRPMEYGRDSVLSQWLGELSLYEYRDDIDGLAYVVDSRDKLNQSPAGYILEEDDGGFIDVSFYATLDDLERAWSEVQAREAAAYASEDEEDEDEIGTDLLQVMEDTRRGFSVPGGLLDEIRQAEREIGYE